MTNPPDGSRNDILFRSATDAADMVRRRDITSREDDTPVTFAGLLGGLTGGYQPPPI